MTNAVVSPFKSDNPTENELKAFDVALQRGMGGDPRNVLKSRYLITLVKPAKPPKPKRSYIRKSALDD